MWYLIFCISGNNLGNGGGVSVECHAPFRVPEGEVACRTLGNVMVGTAREAAIEYRAYHCVKLQQRKR